MLCNSGCACASGRDAAVFGYLSGGHAWAEARAEPVDAVDERLEQLLAARLVEVGEHRVLHVRDRAVARGEHLVAARR